MPVAANALIQVVPGLMIWTIIAFAITFFVLKKFAFGPIQGMIDQRRERIRQSLDEADNARAEARKLLEEHRALIGRARSDAEEILAEARRVADSTRERVREEAEVDRQRRMEGTHRQVEAETRRALEQIRAEVADLTVLATAKVTRGALDPGAHRQLIESAIADLDFSASRAGRTRVAVVHRTYARALFNAAKERDRLDAVRADLAEFVEAAGAVPELRNLLRNPELDPRARSAALGDILEGAEELVRNFLRLLVEKGRATELDEIAAEFERMVAREQGRIEVDLTTAVELSDAEAQTIVGQIEKAAGREVEATRSVDPDLIGGLVLQVGSMRVDASVRGRLERLRHELSTARS